MFAPRRVVVPLALVTLAGCPGGPKVGVDHPGDALPPPIPAKVEVDRIDPMDANDPSARSPLLDIMREENTRWLSALSSDPKAPAYFIGYLITDRRSVVLEASDGGLVIQDDQTNRALDVEVRVGTPELDNRRPIRDENYARLAFVPRAGRVPLGADKKAIARHLWLETDRRYRESALAYQIVQMEDRLGSRRESAPADFSHEKKESFIQAPKKLEPNTASWIDRLKRCSRRASTGVATRATCRTQFDLTTSYYVDSDGSEIQQSWTNAVLMVSVGVKADDGMPLSRLEQAFAATPEGLPGDDRIDEMIHVVTTDLDALHKAPVVDPYEGPAILEGRAAAVFFHEVFGHRIEAHRQKDDTSGQTFSTQVGNAIMPKWLTIYDDPTLVQLNGGYLNGFYRFDDEGVRAQKAMLVDNGTLKGFVQGRQPIKGFARSNGHGRREPGLQAVSRQGNLVVEAARSVEKDKLYDQLIEEIKKEGKPYGMVFTDISGGFTNTSRINPGAFKVNPVMTYRIYPDGRRELVRGVDIVGLPLTALANIINAGRPVETFNGVCGAESGWVPVSASAPSLLLRKLEVERAYQPDDRAPILPAPSISEGGAR